LLDHKFADFLLHVAFVRQYFTDIAEHVRWQSVSNAFVSVDWQFCEDAYLQVAAVCFGLIFIASLWKRYSGDQRRETPCVAIPHYICALCLMIIIGCALLYAHALRGGAAICGTNGCMTWNTLEPVMKIASHLKLSTTIAKAVIVILPVSLFLHWLKAFLACSWLRSAFGAAGPLSPLHSCGGTFQC
jgi:hypothetical protein